MSGGGGDEVHLLLCMTQMKTSAEIREKRRKTKVGEMHAIIHH